MTAVELDVGSAIAAELAKLVTTCWGIVQTYSSSTCVNSSMLNGVVVPSVVHHPTSNLYVYPDGMTGAVADVDASPAVVAPLSMTYR